MVLFHYVVNVAPALSGAPELPFTVAVLVAEALVVALDRELG